MKLQDVWVGYHSWMCCALSSFSLCFMKERSEPGCPPRAHCFTRITADHGALGMGHRMSSLRGFLEPA